MIDLLPIFLRIAGAGLLLLAIIHIPLGKALNWKDELQRLSLVNATIFRVHDFFVCMVVVIMGLPCLLDPQVFLVPTRAGAWLSWSFAAFWAVRLYFQWFFYPAELRRGKPRETALHWWFTCVWTGLTALFATCGAIQAGWLR